MAWQSLRQFKLAVSGTPSTALKLAAIQNAITAQNIRPMARVYVPAQSTVGVGVVMKFGNSSVAADATVNGTTKDLATGNFQQAPGAIETYHLSNDADYVSVISDDASSTGFVWIDIGHETGSH